MAEVPPLEQVVELAQDLFVACEIAMHLVDVVGFYAIQQAEFVRDPSIAHAREVVLELAWATGFLPR
jgi:hypothetical protein